MGSWNAHYDDDDDGGGYDDDDDDYYSYLDFKNWNMLQQIFHRKGKIACLSKKIAILGK